MGQSDALPTWELPGEFDWRTSDSEDHTCLIKRREQRVAEHYIKRAPILVLDGPILMGFPSAT